MIVDSTEKTGNEGREMRNDMQQGLDVDCKHCSLRPAP